jgi:hypothetical protein
MQTLAAAHRITVDPITVRTATVQAVTAGPDGTADAYRPPEQAPRSARRIAMQARREQDRRLGCW